MRRRIHLCLSLAAVIGLAACGDAREELGLSRQAPDEFAVYQRAPLSVPPDYGLRPPVPGSRDNNLMTPTDDARGALLTSTPNAPPATPTPPAGSAHSRGTVALLSRTGALDADPEIRAKINRETTILAEADQSFTERLMFWSTPTVYGTVVDPTAEARRIQENQALGRPLNEGVTPTIARKQRAILEDIF